MAADRSKTVLIVDDEKHLREIIRFDLRKLGLRILEAENGLQAAEVAAHEVVDLVISDVRMPVATGIQLLKNLRERNPGHPPFIFVTAFSDISSEDALDLGAEAFLRKPLSKPELLEVVSRSLTPKTERWAQATPGTDAARRFDFTRDYESWSQAPSADSPTVEIGQGGMFLSITDHLPSSFEVLWFKVESGDAKLGTIEGLGQVRWVRPAADEGLRPGIGLEFLRLDERTRGGLQAYLQARSPRAYIPLGRS